MNGQQAPILPSQQAPFGRGGESAGRRRRLAQRLAASNTPPGAGGRSNDSDTTKGGHEDLLPLPDELVPWIESAVRHSPSDLLLADAEAGRCPHCQMRLWAVAEAKPLRFHDLRHSTATLLLKAGVPLATVQKILRHTDPRITSEVYGHLDVEDMRAGLNRLALGLPPPPELRPLAASLLVTARDHRTWVQRVRRRIRTLRMGCGESWCAGGAHGMAPFTGRRSRPGSRRWLRRTHRQGSSRRASWSRRCF